MTSHGQGFSPVALPEPNPDDGPKV